MDQNFEKCLGKFSDSYEHSLDTFNIFLRDNREAKLISHSQTLDPSKSRGNSYLMGGDINREPAYDKISVN